MKSINILLALIISTCLSAQTGIIIKDSDISCQTLQSDGPPKSQEEFENSLFHSVTTVNLNGEILYLGRAANFATKNFSPGMRRINQGKLEKVTLDFKEYKTKDDQSLRDACSLDDQTILVAGDNGLFKFKKKNNGYALDKFAPFEGDKVLKFTKIVDLGNGKCAAVGYDSVKTEYKGTTVLSRKNNHSAHYKNWKKEEVKAHSNVESFGDFSWYFKYMKDNPYVTNAYLVIWDYNTNKTKSYILRKNVTDEAIIKKYQDGNLLISLSSKPYLNSHSGGINHLSTENDLYLVNIAETMKQNEVRTIWHNKLDDGRTYYKRQTFVLTDLLEESNGDIVFAGIQKDFDQHYYNQSYHTNLYTSFLCIGRIDKTGKMEKINFEKGINLSNWGGSDKGALDIINKPVKRVLVG